jgi:hypothetical protein
MAVILLADFDLLPDAVDFFSCCLLLHFFDGCDDKLVRPFLYLDPTAFSRAFKIWTGLSPRDYRRQSHSRGTTRK